MKRFFILRAGIWICLGLVVGSTARAQFLDSSVGVSAGLVKLFGNVSGFTARTDVQVLDMNRQETLRTPMNFALLDGKVRMEFDMTQMRGKSVQPAVVNGMKQLNLDRVASIIRLDQRITHIIFSGVSSYVDMEISAAEAEAAAKGVQVQQTPLGKETIANHPCIKNKTVVKNAKGAALLEATTWNAEDMKSFPVQIAVQAKEGTTIMRFAEVQMTRPTAAQFEVPAGYKKYETAEALMFVATQKRLISPRTSPTPGATASAPGKISNAPAKPVTTTSTARPAAKSLKASAPAPATKTNTVPSAASKPAVPKK